jgi:hypothetical protein
MDTGIVFRVLALLALVSAQASAVASEDQRRGKRAVAHHEGNDERTGPGVQVSRRFGEPPP